MTSAPDKALRKASTNTPLVSQPLADWLSWLEALHPTAIDMGLARVAAVADRAGLRPAKKPMILVGGTNGKGSTVAMLSAIYSAAGYRTGAYTSPHIYTLLRANLRQRATGG